jgi:hypothetical protein
MLNDDDRRLNNQSITTITHYFTREKNKSIQSELGVKLADICGHCYN